MATQLFVCRITAMRILKFAIVASVATRDRGTIVCVCPDPTSAEPLVGAPVELRRPDGSVFRSTVKAVEGFVIARPAPARPDIAVGVTLSDNPGQVPSGSELYLTE
jgi:hypothetical protein